MPRSAPSAPARRTQSASAPFSTSLIPAIGQSAATQKHSHPQRCASAASARASSALCSSSSRLNVCRRAPARARPAPCAQQARRRRRMAFVAPAPGALLRGSSFIAACRVAPRPSRNVSTPRRPPYATADDRVAALRARQRPSAPLPGTVYLVGAGPGDVGLLTVRARDLLAQADVILYDRLAADSALAYASKSATTLYVGKTAGFHTRSQAEIHALLAAFASTHKTVVRLKGGDPCVFGRGGEEAAYLRSLGVNVQIVPGVTAASGIAASLGFPLTHRGLSNCVKIVTGHLQNGRNPDIGDVDDLTTLVLYMGLAQLPNILAQLREEGLSTRTPAVAVERGTTDREIVVWGTIDELADKVVKRGLQSPTLVVVGEVVALAQGWVDEMQDGRAAACRDRVHELLAELRPEDRALLMQSVQKQN